MIIETKNNIENSSYLDRELTWPDIKPKFLKALKIAVIFIIDELNPIGILLGGSHFKGQVHEYSDLDIIVFQEHPKFRRVFRMFDEIPTDIHIESPDSFSKHLNIDKISPHPKLAYICANSFTILSRSPVVSKLKMNSRKFINGKFPSHQGELDRLKYLSVNYFMDAIDTIKSDPAESVMFVTLAVIEMIKYHYRANDNYIPKLKSMIKNIESRDSSLGDLVRSFFNTPNGNTRLEIARLIANNTIGAIDFFEFDCPFIPEETLDG